MKKIILSVLLFVLAFAVFLVATIPASFAVSFLPKNAPVKLAGVSGTVWNGQASSLIQGGQDLGKLDWSLHPLSLLGLKLSSDFTLNQPRLQANGVATVYRDQSILLKDTQVRGDVEQLPLPEDMLFVSPAGLFQADIATARIQGNRVQEAEGLLVWKPARITSPARYELGEITLDLTGKDGNVTGKLGSKESPLNMTGTLQLAANGMLSTNIRLSPHSGTPQEVRDILPMAGRPAADGSVTIKQRMRVR